MSERRKKCRVCHVEKAVSTLDSTGRCQSCANAWAATARGMTYGKFMALLREGQLGKQVELQNRINHQRDTRIYCKNCGGMVLGKEKYDGFCCRECMVKWEQREDNTKERGTFKEKPKKAERLCKNCGKKVEGGKQYCDRRCRYLFNRDHIMMQQKMYRERKNAGVKK